MKSSCLIGLPAELEIESLKEAAHAAKAVPFQHLTRRMRDGILFPDPSSPTLVLFSYSLTTTLPSYRVRCDSDVSLIGDAHFTKAAPCTRYPRVNHVLQQEVTISLC